MISTECERPFFGRGRGALNNLTCSIVEKVIKVVGLVVPLLFGRGELVFRSNTLIYIIN